MTRTDSEVVLIRRAILKKWMDGKIFPKSERSYFSQLVTGSAPFGERAARRIEKEYDIGHGFLDGIQPELTRKELIDSILATLEEMPLDKLKALTGFIK